MRAMVIIKATKDSETGALPSKELIMEMGKFNEELVDAGVHLAGEGLKPSSKGKRMFFDGSERAVVDGPFENAGELAAGYWLWQVENMDEAVKWVRRCPNPMPSSSWIEIREVYEPEDFADAMK